MVPETSLRTLLLAAIKLTEHSVTKNTASETKDLEAELLDSAKEIERFLRND